MTEESRNRLAELEGKYLSEDAVAEFDNILDGFEKQVSHRKVLRGIAATAAAAAIAVPLIIHGPLSKNNEQMDSLVIAEGMMGLMNLKAGAIESIEAKPKGSKAILTVHLKDGSIQTYIMTNDEKTGSMTLVAKK